MGFGKSLKKIGKKIGKTAKKGLKASLKINKAVLKGAKGFADSELGRSLIGTGANVLLPGVGGAIAGQAYGIRDALKTERAPKVFVPPSVDPEEYEQQAIQYAERQVAAPRYDMSEGLEQPAVDEPSLLERYGKPAAIAGGSALLLFVAMRMLRGKH